MNFLKNYITIVLAITIFFGGCQKFSDGNTEKISRDAKIRPGYQGVTIPPNIAPLNFMIDYPKNCVAVKFSSKKENYQFLVNTTNGKIQIPERKWEKLTKNSIGGKIQVEIYAENTTKKVKKYNPFYIYVAKEKIDPFLVYRLIHPGYYN